MNMKLVVYRRTFEARKHPIGSTIREQFNASGITSEYMPSHKYVVRSDNVCVSFRTKKDAIAWIDKTEDK